MTAVDETDADPSRRRLDPSSFLGRLHPRFSQPLFLDLTLRDVLIVVIPCLLFLLLMFFLALFLDSSLYSIMAWEIVIPDGYAPFRTYGADIITKKRFTSTADLYFYAAIVPVSGLLADPDVAVTCNASLYLNSQLVRVYERSESVSLSKSSVVQVFSAPGVESNHLGIQCDMTRDVAAVTGCSMEFVPELDLSAVYTAVFLVVSEVVGFFCLGFSHCGATATCSELHRLHRILFVLTGPIAARVPFPDFVDLRKPLKAADLVYKFAHLFSVSMSQFFWVAFPLVLVYADWRMGPWAAFSGTIALTGAIIVQWVGGMNAETWTTLLFVYHFILQGAVAVAWLILLFALENQPVVVFKYVVLGASLLSSLSFWCGYAAPDLAPQLEFFFLHVTDVVIAFCFWALVVRSGSAAQALQKIETRRGD
jgi:hypothetical protein